MATGNFCPPPMILKNVNTYQIWKKEAQQYDLSNYDQNKFQQT